MKKEMLGIAQCLAVHPVLNEKHLVRINYINALEYFVNRYSKNNVLAIETFNLYKQIILKDIPYSYNVEVAEKIIKSVTGLRSKGFKLFTYRYIFLFDCVFINAFDELETAKKIYEDVKELFNVRYHNRINKLFSVLYGTESDAEFKELTEQLNSWKMNKNHLSTPIRKILITANMSAGKSTLINALVGKKINKTQNDACTAKIHYIFNKPFEDGYISEFDYKLDMNADLETLMQDDPENKDNEISVGTYFRTTVPPKERICIVDTPGVNSAVDEKHRDLSYDFISAGDYDIVICLLNASNIGTFDDRNHLQHLAEDTKNKQIIFAINQLDKFNKDEDSIEECIDKVRQETLSLGFKDARFCPISAYAGLLAKKQIYGESMSDVEKIELQMFILKFKDNYTSMKKYFSYPDEDFPENSQDDVLNQACWELLKHSGITNLEKIIFEYARNN